MGQTATLIKKLSVAMSSCYAECGYAEGHNAECGYAERCYAERRYAEHRYAERHCTTNLLKLKMQGLYKNS
jgi:hypothetical protein